MKNIQDFAYGVVPVFKTNDGILFLIVQHAPGHWSFPKGHKEGSEAEIETAQRELLEETGITECDIQEEKYFLSTHTFTQDNRNYQKTNKYFLGFPKNTNINIPKEWSHEIVQAKWCTYNEAKRLINFEPIICVLNEVNRLISLGETGK